MDRVLFVIVTEKNFSFKRGKVVVAQIKDKYYFKNQKIYVAVCNCYSKSTSGAWISETYYLSSENYNIKWKWV